MNLIKLILLISVVILLICIVYRIKPNRFIREVMSMLLLKNKCRKGFDTKDKSVCILINNINNIDEYNAVAKILKTKGVNFINISIKYDCGIEPGELAIDSIRKCVIPYIPYSIFNNLDYNVQSKRWKKSLVKSNQYIDNFKIFGCEVVYSNHLCGDTILFPEEKKLSLLIGCIDLSLWSDYIKDLISYFQFLIFISSGEVIVFDCKSIILMCWIIDYLKNEKYEFKCLDKVELKKI